MKKASATLALCLLLLVGYAAATAKSGESKEQKDRRNSCDGLVNEPPKPTTTSPRPTTPAMVPAPPPGECVCTPTTAGATAASPTGETDFQSHCELVEAFYNMTVLLTVQEQIIWEAWIVEIEDTILANVTLTADEKVVAIAISLRAFFSVNIDIYNVLCYQEIGSWGFVIDFLYVEIDIQLTLVPAVVALDSSNQCELTQAILNASVNGSPAEQSACQQLVVEIQAILEESVTYEVQLGMLFQCFEAFFAQNPSMESFVLSIEIEGFGSIQSLVDVCKVYEQIVTISEVLSGSTTSDCVLLAALESASKNSSFTSAQQAQILQLEAKIQVYFSSTTNYSLRLEYVSFTCYEMFLLEPWMVEIIESIWCAEWGSIYDIIFCSGICTNYGCGNLGSEVTTKAPTTTTQAPTTTTMQPANCNTIPALIVVSKTNTTILTSTLTTAYNTWTSSQKAGFNTYFNDVRTAIWNNKTYPSVNSKLTFIRTSLYQYNNNSVVNQQLVFNITITSWEGTVGEFVACCGHY